MREIKEYEYPYQEDNSELKVAILNSQPTTTESYIERSDNCHIATGVESSQAVQKFINWIEETTDTKLETIWGVWYRDGGGIKWHTHKGNFRYSFASTYRSQRVVHHYILAKIQKQLNQLSSMQIKEFVWYGIMISHIAYLLVIIKVDVYCQVI